MTDSQYQLKSEERTYFLDLYRLMVTSREIDRKEDELVRQGYGFFHISGAGHEASATLDRHLISDDFLHLHYRDKALALRRGLSREDFFLSLLCKKDSLSSGRQMSVHFSNSLLNLLSVVGPVGNSALQAVGAAGAIAELPSHPIVVCGVGDGTSQQGEFLEAVAEAVRKQFPVLFLIEDNGFAISTRTSGTTFFTQDGCHQLFGLPIHKLDGTDVFACDREFAHVISEIREHRRPQIVVMQVSRLSDHTNADDQERYRSLWEVATDLATHDPIYLLQDRLLQSGIELGHLKSVRDDVVLEVEAAAETALQCAEPEPEPTAKAHFPDAYLNRKEYRGTSATDTVMREALNKVLHQRLQSDSRVVLYGEDIEDPKGDVFGVTRGLSTEFPGRVQNSPLSESTIVGTSIGRALAGQKPVAFLQFADFLPLAWNQIISEMGSMYWRTQGDWQCPVIVMITCGGYRPGLGPFHAQTLESVAAHTPGIDVVMPSTAADAAGLFNAAFESNRPTLFFYPKSCLNLNHLATSADAEQQFVPLGSARFWKRGNDLTIVSWGNPLIQCEEAAQRLEQEGIGVDLIDLRSLSPWDEEAVMRSCEKTGLLIVVHEDNMTCGFGAEVVATVTENASAPIRVRRVARPDTFVPCNFENQLEILPSTKKVLAAAAELLDLDLTWQQETDSNSELYLVEAIGSGPADDEVTVVEIAVQPGERVTPGMLLIEAESTKSVVEITATVDGTVLAVLHEVGAVVPVGTPLISIIPEQQISYKKPVTQYVLPECEIAIRPHQSVASAVVPATERQTVILQGIARRVGSRTLTNQELLSRFPDWTETDVLKRTGIRTRRWVADGETLLSMSVEAAAQVLEANHIDVGELGLVIATTTTPDQVTPSLACRILAELQPVGSELHVPAMDINAACSGYLYAMQIAWDHLQAEPDRKILIVTSEILSPLVDPDDPQTAFIFGDAATASLVAANGDRVKSPGVLSLSRPVLDGEPEPGDLLSVPLCGSPERIQMQGHRVFEKAVRCMTRVTKEACRREGLETGQLAWVIPHQANERILNAVEKRTGIPVYKNLDGYGNTSSSTIPLALQSFLADQNRLNGPIGICAFGGGFTSAAVIAYP